jgi:hypothetical protein
MKQVPFFFDPISVSGFDISVVATKPDWVSEIE